MSTAEPTIPDIALKQAKTIEGTAASFYKGGMGLALQNFQRMFQVNDWNVKRFQDKCDGKEPGSDEGDKTATDDPMRIDSDDINYHFHTQTPWVPKPVAPLGSSLLKIGVGAALAGTGIGLPLALPSIISGIGELMKPAATAPTNPGTPSINLGGRDYELRLGQEE